MSTNLALELAIFSVKAEKLEGYSGARSRMRAAIEGWEGFRSGVTFRSIGNPQILADYYLWDGMVAATKAADSFMEHPESQDFLSCIDEVKFHGHFEVGEDIPRFTDLAPGEVMELALGEVDPDNLSVHRAIKPKLFDLVRSQPGLKQIASSSALLDGKHLNLDVLRWASSESAKAAMDRVHPAEECATFMSTFKADIHFDHMASFS